MWSLSFSYACFLSHPVLHLHAICCNLTLTPSHALAVTLSCVHSLSLLCSLCFLHTNSLFLEFSLHFTTLSFPLTHFLFHFLYLSLLLSILLFFSYLCVFVSVFCFGQISNSLSLTCTRKLSQVQLLFITHDHAFLCSLTLLFPHSCTNAPFFVPLFPFLCLCPHSHVTFFLMTLYAFSQAYSCILMPLCSLSFSHHLSFLNTLPYYCILSPP